MTVKERLKEAIDSPAWCYDENGQDFQYADIELLRKAYAEIDSLLKWQDSYDDIYNEAKRLKNELEKHRWIPVEEALPESAKELEVFNGKIVIGYYGRKRGGTEYFFLTLLNSFFINDVTHWRYPQLPEKS